MLTAPMELRNGTERMSGRIVPTSTAVMHDAAARLRAGKLVAFPTETVYGLGADADNADAVRAIFAAKGRPADHPVIVHVVDVAAIAAWARDVPASAHRLAAAFWPGPLTMILPRAPGVLDVVTGGQDSVGLRVPSHPAARALLQAFVQRGGRGIAAPSANRFGRISPTTAAHVEDDLGDRVDLIVDGGPCEVGIESTIVAFLGADAVLLRPGGIAIDAIVRVLGHAPSVPDTAAPRASGTLESHYAPRTPARTVMSAALPSEAAKAQGRIAVLARTADAPAGFSGQWLRASRDPVAYAHDLYANLRTLDAVGAHEILIEAVPTSDAWLAIVDRITRAVHAEDGDTA